MELEWNKILLLSAALQLVRCSEDSWTSWSAWTPCSRSCSGGVTQSFRKCKWSSGLCHGVSVRSRLCNTQPCGENSIDYRWEQCKAFNGQVYRGRGRTWTPHEHPAHICALFCRAEGTHLVVKLAPTVKDGTSCSKKSLDVCISGVCEQVGCDLKIGSPKKVDECGVCGGPGNACVAPVYRWQVVPTAGAQCSKSCGGGEMRVHVLCSNGLTQQNVHQHLCHSQTKPYRKYSTCNNTPCHTKWQAGNWTECSASCGFQGKRTRSVVCSESDGREVADSYCSHLKRRTTQEACNQKACSSWHVGPWSPCSATCNGTRTRNVVCRDSHNLPSWTCDDRLTPTATLPCGNCSEHLTMPILEGHTLPLMDPIPPLDNRFVDGNAVLLDKNAVPAEPTFVVEEWGQCSHTCGQGTRRRQVKCKIFLEFSRTIATLPDKECLLAGPKPSEWENCFSRPCQHKDWEENLSDSHHAALADSDTSTYTRKTISVGLPPGMQDMTFSLRLLGYTPCSASCLGGIQEAMIQCVRDYDQRIVTPVLCQDIPPPDVATTRTCNDHSCPPRWNVSDFGSCSKACGGGVSTRQVSCIHEVTRGNTVNVPAAICPQPVPNTEKVCNIVNCPPYWQAGPWSRCTKPCDGGERRRKVVCKQVISLGQTVELADGEGHCILARPMDLRPCNKKPCTSRKGEEDQQDNFLQLHFKRKLALSVKGHATVFNGVQVKLRCPSPKKVNLVWMKGHQFVSIQTGKVQVLNNGILKISNLTFSDSGVYTCLLQSGQAVSNLTLMVRPVEQERWVEKRTQRPLSTLFADQEQSVRMWDEVITPNSEILSSTSRISFSSPLLLFLFLFAVLWGRGAEIDWGSRTHHNTTNKKHYHRCNRNISCANPPSWKLGNWSQCLAHFCFNWNSAFRFRWLTCEGEFGGLLADGECGKRPAEKEECFNKECVGFWQPGKWSQCKSRCGSLGLRTRVVECVWPSGLPAGAACVNKERPLVTKPCIVRSGVGCVGWRGSRSR